MMTMMILIYLRSGLLDNYKASNYVWFDVGFSFGKCERAGCHGFTYKLLDGQACGMARNLTSKFDIDKCMAPKPQSEQPDLLELQLQQLHKLKPMHLPPDCFSNDTTELDARAHRAISFLSIPIFNSTEKQIVYLHLFCRQLCKHGQWMVSTRIHKSYSQNAEKKN